MLEIVGAMYLEWHHGTFMQLEFNVSNLHGFQSNFKSDKAAATEALGFNAAVVNRICFDGLMLWAVYCFRQFVKCFYVGDIFSSNTVRCARKIIQWGWLFLTYKFIFFLLAFSQKLITAVGEHTISFSFQFDAQKDFPLLLCLFVYWTFSFALVWILEIARDLNEESKLTI